MKYGDKPQIIDTIDIECQEMMFYLYLPIKMKGSKTFRIPKRLNVFQDLIKTVIGKDRSFFDKYVYITAKHIYVTPDNLGNRAGYHSDGFGTNDINYIWTNKFPTIFSVQDFDLSTDCEISMTQMEEQARIETEVVYPVNTLLKLTESCIHRTPVIEEGAMRTFVKISISDEKYNLAGNSHNYLFNYDWKMHERAEVRNHPTLMESDFLKK